MLSQRQWGEAGRGLRGGTKSAIGSAPHAHRRARTMFPRAVCWHSCATTQPPALVSRQREGAVRPEGAAICCGERGVRRLTARLRVARARRRCRTRRGSSPGRSSLASRSAAARRRRVLPGTAPGPYAQVQRRACSRARDAGALPRRAWSSAAADGSASLGFPGSGRADAGRSLELGSASIAARVASLPRKVVATAAGVAPGAGPVRAEPARWLSLSRSRPAARG